MSILKEGTPVVGVKIGDRIFDTGTNSKSITVSMEAGQMSGVPWFHVVYNDGSQLLINGEQVSIVHITSVEEELPNF